MLIIILDSLLHIKIIKVKQLMCWTFMNVLILESKLNKEIGNSNDILESF